MCEDIGCIRFCLEIMNKQLWSRGKYSVVYQPIPSHFHLPTSLNLWNMMEENTFTAVPKELEMEKSSLRITNSQVQLILELCKAM